MQARGPACDRYLQQLEQECEELWKNGRQMCEEMSLTGNHCVNEVSLNNLIVPIQLYLTVPVFVLSDKVLFCCKSVACCYYLFSSVVL